MDFKYLSIQALSNLQAALFIEEIFFCHPKVLYFDSIVQRLIKNQWIFMYDR